MFFKKSFLVQLKSVNFSDDLHYQWYICPNTILTNEINQNFTPTEIGDYKVEITLNGCIIESNCFTVNSLSINLHDLDNLVYFPNPTNGILNISNSNTISEIIIYNNLGQKVLEKLGISNEISLDLSELVSATYYIKIISEGKSNIIKVVKI